MLEGGQERKATYKVAQLTICRQPKLER